MIILARLRTLFEVAATEWRTISPERSAVLASRRGAHPLHVAARHHARARHHPLARAAAVPDRHRIVVPAILKAMPKSRTAFVLYTPLVFFLVGLPFFFIALADPYSALVSRDVSFPGRRICTAWWTRPPACARRSPPRP